jgi:hypothetical protein
MKSFGLPGKLITQASLKLLILLLPLGSIAQTQKQVTHQNQVWLSLNNTVKLSPRWGVIADFHVLRRNNFIENPGFYFIRFGASYRVNQQLTTTAGYGHMWVANNVQDGFLYTNENRIYEQLQYALKSNKSTVSLRFRNEQRWQEKINAGKKMNDTRFTNRMRFLTSVNFQVFKDPRLPRLMVADEVMVHFGKEVVYNTFDQNRFTIGIQQKISKTLSFDAGYMYVFQQKYSGYQYDSNNTIRLFFYWTPDCSKSFKKGTPRRPL